MSEIGKYRKISNEAYISKSDFDTSIANKPNESRKLYRCENNRDNGQDSKGKEKQKIASPKTLFPTYSPAVLIPSTSQKYKLSSISNCGDNILHPELTFSPRTGDIVNRRGTFYLGRRRKLIIGSIGDKGKANI